MSISERLQQELKTRTPAMSTRQFQKAVEAEAGEGTRGTSYASVYEYVEGKGTTEPPLSFLRPAAEVLGVRVEWLVSGRGYPTEEHAKAARTAAATVSAQIKIGDIFEITGSGPGPAMLHRKVFKKLGRPLSDTPPPWLAGLIEVWLQLSEGSDTDTNFEAMVVETVMGPLKRMGCDPVKMQDARRFDAYVFAVTPVMLMLAVERTRQGEALESQEEN